MMPKKIPTAGPIRMTSGQGTPAASAIARSIMDSAITEPTERSMPAVRMTRYMPSASSAFMAICRRMLVRFCADRKYSGCRMVRTTPIASTTIMIP